MSHEDRIRALELEVEALHLRIRALESGATSPWVYPQYPTSPTPITPGTMPWPWMPTVWC